MNTLKDKLLRSLEPFDLVSSEEAADRIEEISATYRRDVEAHRSGVSHARRRELLERIQNHGNKLSELLVHPDALIALHSFVASQHEDLRDQAEVERLPEPGQNPSEDAAWPAALRGLAALAETTAKSLPEGLRGKPETVRMPRRWLTLSSLVLFAECRISHLEHASRRIDGFRPFVTRMVRYASLKKENFQEKDLRTSVQAVLTSRLSTVSLRQELQWLSEEFAASREHDSPDQHCIQKAELRERIESFETLRIASILSGA